MTSSPTLQQEQKQSLKQTQRLMMSPQMQQAIHLLQLPVMELTPIIDSELQQNPVLEYEEEPEPLSPEEESLEQEVEEEKMELETPLEKEVVIDDHDFDLLKRLDEELRDHFAESSHEATPRTHDDEKLQSFLENAIRTPTTLFDQLIVQAHESFNTTDELKMAEAIIGNLDERGFLTGSLEEIALLNSFDQNQLARILREIQTFDPPGIAAVNLQQSLLLQLERQGKSHHLAYTIVEKYFDDLTHNKIPSLRKKLNCSPAAIQEAIEKDIAKLDLHPGFGYVSSPSQPIIPDIKIREDNGELHVEVNNDSIPPLRLNRRYLQLLEDPSLPLETKEYIQQKVVSSRWLLRNLRQRSDTLERIAASLLKTQKSFFSDPKGSLTPLTMKQVAEELDLHESTVARAVANKYIDCPRGLLALRSFFTHGYTTEEGEDISSSTVKEALLEILANEDKKKPLSDEKISGLMKKQGIPCARRTVAKYRTLYQIGNTTQRKQAWSK